MIIPPFETKGANAPPSGGDFLTNAWRAALDLCAYLRGAIEERLIVWLVAIQVNRKVPAFADGV